MPDSVTQWLTGLGLSQYAYQFEENAVSWNLLPKLNHELLKEIGITAVGHRIRILEAVATLETGQSAPMPGPVQPVTGGEAERRQLTVMFCDMVGSTELSQRLDPEDLRKIYRAFQDACKKAIEQYEGYIAKYMGDGVLAYFGYPQAHEDDAERAIHSGLSVVESVLELNSTEKQGRDIELSVRVGIATGPVVVGDLIGEGASQESAVVGETPNLAARLQDLANKNEVVIGPVTRDLAGMRFKYEDVGTHTLKGFAKPVQFWSVIAVSAESRFDTSNRANLTPLVGREHEIGLLIERWTQAREGDGQVVLLSGEPGIGKSRVVEILREHTEVDDLVSLRYQCSSYYTNTALRPVIEQLERAAQLDPGDTNEVKLNKLESLLSPTGTDTWEATPLLASLLSIPTEDRYAQLDMTPTQQKERTLETVVSQIEELSRRQPVLFIFEDLHWADPTSLELLEIIIARVQGIPALGVFTFRPEFSPPWSGHTHVTSLTLNRFTHNLASEMIKNVAGENVLPDEMIEQIIAKTDGVPLFVEELTKTILESGVLLERTDRNMSLGPLPGVAIPATLHDSLMERLDRLGAVKEIAQTASTIGREFDYDLLAVVSLLDSQILQDGLDQLVKAELVFRSGRTGGGGYIFKHALVQDAAYGSLLKSKRQELHGRIANSLQDQFPERVDSEPETLAHHYTEAGLTESAITHWLMAGRITVKRGAYAEAISQLERGIMLLDDLPEIESRARREIELRVTLGVSLVGNDGGSSPSVKKNYHRAQILCEQIGENEHLFTILWGQWFHAMMCSHLQEACRLADQLLSVSQKNDDEIQLLESHHCQWASHFLVGEFPAVIEHAEHGIGLYCAEDHHSLTFTFGGHDPGVCAYSQAALALWMTGYPEKARKRFNKGLSLAKNLGHSGTLANEAIFGIIIAIFERDSHELMKWAKFLDEYVSTERIANLMALGQLARGWVKFHGGDHEAGLKQMRRWSPLLLEQDPWVIEFSTLMASALGQCGNVNEGLELINKVQKNAEHSEVHWWDAELFRVKGKLLLCNSPTDAPSAEHCFNQAIEVARRQCAKSLELRSVTSLALLYEGQGVRDEARKILTPVYDWFTEGFDTADLKEAKTLLEQLS